jgi:hypothetical protein
MKKFNVKDLDQKKLRSLIEIETDSIFNSPKSRGDRNRETIRRAVSQGKPSELYLVEKHGFAFAENLYDDLVINGIYVEVKSWFVQNVKKNMVQFNNRCKGGKWFKAETLLIFTPDKSLENYSFYGMYRWNVNHFERKEMNVEFHDDC